VEVRGCRPRRSSAWTDTDPNGHRPTLEGYRPRTSCTIPSSGVEVSHNTAQCSIWPHCGEFRARSGAGPQRTRTALSDQSGGWWSERPSPTKPLRQLKTSSPRALSLRAPLKWRRFFCERPPSLQGARYTRETAVERWSRTYFHNCDSQKENSLRIFWQAGTETGFGGRRHFWRHKGARAQGPRRWPAFDRRVPLKLCVSAPRKLLDADLNYLQDKRYADGKTVAAWARWTGSNWGRRVFVLSQSTFVAGCADFPERRITVGSFADSNTKRK